MWSELVRFGRRRNDMRVSRVEVVVHIVRLVRGRRRMGIVGIPGMLLLVLSDFLFSIGSVEVDPIFVVIIVVGLLVIFLLALLPAEGFAWRKRWTLKRSEIGERRALHETWSETHAKDRLRSRRNESSGRTSQRVTAALVVVAIPVFDVPTLEQTAIYVEAGKGLTIFLFREEIRDASSQRRIFVENRRAELDGELWINEG